MADKMKNGLRGYYGALYQTPYLYSSDAMKRYAQHTKSDEEMRAIYHHLKRHGVWDDKQYKGYYAVTRTIQEHFYEEHEVGWNNITDFYSPFVQFDGSLKLKPRGPMPFDTDFYDKEYDFDHLRYLTSGDDEDDFTF